MKIFRLCQTVTCIALLSISAFAVDLSKIDRSIAKEPTYQTDTQKYCLLVFGPDAGHRVWIGLDGDTLYVDKNGNGDLTDEGERIKAPGFKESKHPMHARQRSIAVGDISINGLTHANLIVSQSQYRRKIEVNSRVGALTPEQWQEHLDSVWRKVPDGIDYMVRIELNPNCYGQFENVKDLRVNHFAWADHHGLLSFADCPKEAPLIHFGGPLTIRHQPDGKLCQGNNPGTTTLYLGTRGLGPGTFATMCYDIVPKGVHPTLEVQFPIKEPGQKPVTRKYVLKERC